MIIDFRPEQERHEQIRHFHPQSHLTPPRETVNDELNSVVSPAPQIFGEQRCVEAVTVMIDHFSSVVTVHENFVYKIGDDNIR